MCLLAWILVICCIGYLLSLLPRWFQQRKVREMIDHHRAIASFEVFNARTLLERLEIRARANKRLMSMFGINNSFTTNEKVVHQKFLREVHKVIGAVADEKWVECWRTSRFTLETIREYYGQCGLEQIVRVMAFSVVLEVVFPHKRRDMISVSDIEWITRTINQLWIRSKSSDEEACDDHDEVLGDLREKLSHLIPRSSTDPLSMILPAYETLWRVVLLTYVHVAFRRVDVHTENALEVALRAINSCSTSWSDTVTMFSSEALRLYPPTKRIYRASQGCTKAADVEALHRNKQIWGADADEFRPTRFSELTKDQEDAYMPFGIGRHVCPAAKGFAGNMIALLVLALISSLGTKTTGATIHFGDESLDEYDDVPLPTGRDAAKSWLVFRA